MSFLLNIYDKYGFEPENIKEIVFGKTYSGIQLISGEIGLSANLFGIKSIRKTELNTIDFNNFAHRNVLIAYYNALLNNSQTSLFETDIFDYINFVNYSDIVMIGFSEPMYNKLKKQGIKLTVFDDSHQNSIIKNANDQQKYLKHSDLVILTATSIVNNTFDAVVKNTNLESEIYIFGASTMLTENLFSYQNIKGLFGTVFKISDSEIMNIIKEGHGHRYLKNHGKKVALVKGK